MVQLTSTAAFYVIMSVVVINTSRDCLLGARCFYAYLPMFPPSAKGLAKTVGSTDADIVMSFSAVLLPH